MITNRIRVTLHLAPVSCPTEPCVVCRRAVFTCELGECPQPGEHMEGGQLRSGAWVCSESCWEATEVWPRPLTWRLIAHRALALVAIFLVALGYAVPTAGTRYGLVLAGSTAAVAGLVLWAAELIPPAPPGQVRAARPRR